MKRLSHRRGGVAAARRGERGSVLVIVALSLTVIVICTALTIDLGRVSTARRDLQNVADAVALDLVRLVDGRTAAEVVTDPRWASTLAASLDRNAFVPGGDRAVEVAVGTYDTVAQEFAVVTGATIPRAVRVVAADRVDYQLVPGGSSTSRRAVASQQATGGIQVGSFAARLDSSRSALLQGLLGDAFGVSAVSYQGLAGGRVGLAELATELSFGSPEELLASSVGVGDLLTAQAEILRRGGDVARANALDQVVAGLPAPEDEVAMGDMMTVGAGGEEATADASFDVLELLTATGFVANGSSSLTVPQVTLTLPGGLVTQTSSLTVTERPAFAFGPVGTSAQTAQIRLDTTLQVSLPGVATATIVLSVEVASATATIADLGCGTPRRLGVDVTTGVASARAEVTARVLALGVLPVADVDLHADTLADPQVRPVDFVLPPDQLGVAREHVGPTIDLGGAEVEVDQVEVLATPLGVNIPALVANLVGTVVGPLVDQLDTALVQPLLGLFGAAAPGADVTPLAVTCGGRGLVA
jgi:uncharacterized membrane protein